MPGARGKRPGFSLVLRTGSAPRLAVHASNVKICCLCNGSGGWTLDPAGCGSSSRAAIPDIAQGAQVPGYDRHGGNKDRTFATAWRPSNGPDGERRMKPYFLLSVCASLTFCAGVPAQT